MSDYLRGVLGYRGVGLERFHCIINLELVKYIRHCNYQDGDTYCTAVKPDNYFAASYNYIYHWS